MPENIGDREHLKALWLNGNHLSGEIPESMGNLMNLELLYLSDNNLSGSIPESLCSLNIDWDGVNNWGNEICLPYPSCMDAEIVGDQYCATSLGDVNGDGALNILDIVIIANIILGSTENVSDADVNQDGEVNSLDIVALVNVILN